MKRISIFALTLAMAACGGGGGSDSNTQPPVVREAVNISGIDAQSTISRTDPINLNVSGTDAVVTIAAGVDIGMLDIGGIRPSIVLQPGAAAGIDACRMSSTNGTVYVPDGEAFTCSISGTGNAIAHIIELASTGGTVNLNRYDTIALWITGMNQTISVTGTATVKRLEVEGSNNLLAFAESVTVEACEIGGSDNTVTLKEADICTDTGIGNTITPPPSSP